MTTLTPKLRTLLLMAVKARGTYDPAICLTGVEEHFNAHESRTAITFLRWCHAGHPFGHGNIDQRYAEFRRAR